jgi:hypothetical protein
MLLVLLHGDDDASLPQKDACGRIETQSMEYDGRASFPDSRKAILIQ